MRSNRLGSQAGFSVIQVMLAIGISSILSLALAELFSMITAVQRRAHLDGEIVQLMDDARLALQRSGACMNTLATSGLSFAAVSPLSFPLTSINDENNRGVISVGQTDDGILDVKGITFELNPIHKAWLPKELMAADLIVDISGRSDMLLGTNSWRRRVTVTVETGALGQIIGCNSLSVTERQTLEEVLCQSLGGQLQGKICDLKNSKSISRAACIAIGSRSNGGIHCD